MKNNMDIGYLGIILCVLLCVADVKQHNDKVDNMYPDTTDSRQFHYHSELTISYVGYVFTIIVAAAFFIKSCFGG